MVKYVFTTWEYKKEPEKYLEKSTNGERTRPQGCILKTKYLKWQRTP